jgi:hypothetical protein
MRGATYPDRRVRLAAGCDHFHYPATKDASMEDDCAAVPPVRAEPERQRQRRP